MAKPEPLGLGYGLAYDWRQVLCVGGTARRPVRTYSLLHRPKKKQADLFDPT